MTQGQMTQDDRGREVALPPLADEIRVRTETPHSEYVDREQALSAARSMLETARAAVRGAGGSRWSGFDPAPRRRTAATNREP